MRRKGVDNFAAWRAQARKDGVVKSSYPMFTKNGDLAELIGAVLGDGYIGKHPRTECLRIVCNANNPGCIARYAEIMERVFGKAPRVRKRGYANAVDIVLYERHIAQRLGLETGKKTHRPFTLPAWIRRSRAYQLRFLRGLYETDG